ncbi:hypothetical protein N0V93_003476 [Gnomoniopsis smithogilvyi]|uniref:Uncharacterized protein n=1 Tax=Gnomoniopsis smithogilvyi TaxID=1191159 RepID=A0A9W9D053_9PEZI|nr:hypothetical protein N0V93_003476 [Gnomoniopsis smithogilvyi]
MRSGKEPSETHNVSSTQQGTGEGKGKGLASGDDTQEETGSSSVLSRIGHSATALSRSAIHGTPAVNDLASFASSDKPEAPSSSRKADALIGGTSTANAASSSGTSSFRSKHTNAHVAAEEAAFSDFLDGTNVHVPSEPLGFAQAWQSATSATTPPTGLSASRGEAGSSVAEQQARDGVEVVRLLSQSEEELPEYEEQMVLSEPELKSLRQALFEDGSPAQISASDWNNVLNFIPDFLRGQGNNHGILETSESSFMSLGVTDTAEAAQMWLEEWNRVLTGYNDEVWGDLGDLVQQARIEVQKIRDGQENQTPDPVALRRLRTVLHRVRARL